ncbi:MAG: DUF393 domain-containing protein [Phycisphaerales bacterium]|nr:MAG: DUF393 domain-containing protein [Phycisphaerales bacterium]
MMVMHTETTANPAASSDASKTAPKSIDRPVVVFDGTCGFCQNQVARIQRWDRADQFAYVSSHEPNLLEHYPQLAGEDLEAGMRLIEPSGALSAGADAVHAIARRLPRFKWIAWLYRVPGVKQIARLIYGWIARRRHKLGQTCSPDGACRIDR